MKFARIIPALSLVLVIFMVGGCGTEEPESSAQEVSRNVRILALSRSDISEFFEISGPVSPVRGTWLSAQESGPVVAIAIDKGQSVDKGGIIIEQERDILRAERDAFKAALATQEYNVDKVRQLFDAGKVSRIELLTSESNFAQAKSMADVSEERYQRAGIRAPFAGVVTDRYVELGELVNPGQRVARLIDPYTLKLEAYLTGNQVQWVTEGEGATVLLGDNNLPAEGRVTWVGFEADRMTGKFQVEIEIPNNELNYNSGVIGRAKLGKNQEAGVVVIPRDAVLSGRVGPTAYVVEDDRAVLRQLQLGSDQGLMVIVREGLEPGDKLVVRGQRELREGALVKVTEVAEARDGSLSTDPDELSGAHSGSRIGSTESDKGVEGNR
jgi:membrane fusion protein (multidrug efflux system)